jgi:hypothetical protein
MMHIEFLYWEECPSHETALGRLRTVLREEAVDAPVEIIRVDTEEQAAVRRFPGSPTIRINGADIQPPGESPVGLSCRVYHTDDGRVTPLPTTEMIRRAIRAAVRRSEPARTNTAAQPDRPPHPE